MRFPIVGALAAVFLAALLISLPFWANLAVDATHLAAYAAAGAWLQGALTPLLLGVAIISFWIQRRSAETQAKAQADANDIAAWTFFIDNVNKLAGHLSYGCMCAIYGQQLPGDYNPTGQRLGFQAMPFVFKGFNPVQGGVLPPMQGREPLILEEMRGNEQYAILAKEINQVLALSRQVKLEGMLDSRITDIRNLIERYPPTRSSASPGTR